jgi:endonuclease/exonuclease/phosphatase family metal-dependent hydrolase
MRFFNPQLQRDGAWGRFFLAFAAAAIALVGALAGLALVGPPAGAALVGAPTGGAPVGTPAGAPRPALAARTTDLMVMTRNLYLGADLIPLATASPGAPFERAAGAMLNAVRATDPNARMRLVAEEIASARPDLVGLQEVSLWRTGPIGGVATHVVFDYLATIRAELAHLHAPYRVAAEELGLNIEAPTDQAVDVRLTLGDAVLVRAGVTVSHVRVGLFKSQLRISTRQLGSVSTNRSWNAMDATVRGAHIHFVNTHLEAYSSSIRLEQANELVAGPLRSRLTTIVAGDFNSGPNLPQAADRPPFQAIARAGFVDERTPSYSCCLNDDLRTGRWDHNVDHIMAKPQLRLVRSYVTGRETTASGVHPSDHGGLVSVLRVSA